MESHLRMQSNPSRPLLIKQRALRPNRVEQVVRYDDRNPEHEAGIPPKPLSGGEDNHTRADRPYHLHGNEYQPSNLRDSAGREGEACADYEDLDKDEPQSPREKE